MISDYLIGLEEMSSEEIMENQKEFLNKVRLNMIENKEKRKFFIDNYSDIFKTFMALKFLYKERKYKPSKQDYNFIVRVIDHNLDLLSILCDIVRNIENENIEYVENVSLYIPISLLIVEYIFGDNERLLKFYKTIIKSADMFTSFNRRKEDRIEVNSIINKLIFKILDKEGVLGKQIKMEIKLSK